MSEFDVLANASDMEPKEAETAMDDSIQKFLTWPSPKKKDIIIPYVQLEHLMGTKSDYVRKQLRKQCWETAIGQEIIKITVMDLVRFAGLLTVLKTIIPIVKLYKNTYACSS